MPWAGGMFGMSHIDDGSGLIRLRRTRPGKFKLVGNDKALWTAMHFGGEHGCAEPECHSVKEESREIVGSYAEGVIESSRG